MTSLRLTGVTSELAKAQQLLAQWWCDHHLSDVERFPFDLALEELFINVASYGHDETGAPCRVELALIQSDVASEGEKDTSHRIVSLVIKDNGPAFDPISMQTPDLDGTLQTKEIGGLGIHLTRSVMDSIDYEYKDGHNRVSVTKKIIS